VCVCVSVCVCVCMCVYVLSGSLFTCPRLIDFLEAELMMLVIR